MFEVKEKKKYITRPMEIETTIINKGIFIEGRTFKGVGTVRIEGVFIGEMFVDGHIIVGQTGEIRGNVTCNSMLVAGIVLGNIICKKDIHITDTADIEGDIQTEAIIVDEGAGINGSLYMRSRLLEDSISVGSQKSLSTVASR